MMFQVTLVKNWLYTLDIKHNSRHIITEVDALEVKMFFFNSHKN